MQVETPREFSRESVSVTRSIEHIITNATVQNVITLPSPTVVMIPTGSTVRDAIQVRLTFLVVLTSDS